MRRSLESWASCARSLERWSGRGGLHVLVTHQEGSAPHGSRRTDAASARLHHLREPSGQRPAPARPAPAPRWRHPPQPAAPAPACGTGGRTPGRAVGFRGWPWRLLPGCSNGPRERVRPPASTPTPVPSSQSRSPSRLRAPVIFPFPRTGPSPAAACASSQEGQGPEPPAGSSAPLRSWACPGPRAGLNLPIGTAAGQAVQRGFGGKTRR